MAIPVLVVTPNVGFGELICQILEETGEYVLGLASNGNDALVATRSEKPAMGILETNLEGMDVTDLVAGMRKEVPDMLLVLISPEQGSQTTDFPVLDPDGVLSKPVYLPDLVTKVERVFDDCGIENLHRAEKKKKKTRKAARKQIAEADAPPPPEWLQDVNSAAQYLTRLSLESSAQASLIAKEAEIWAYAGELARPAAEELARTVSSYFVNGGSGDLARFIRLEETGNEYMLYATGLGGDYILATVFDAEMPFSQIRAQASSLADALAQSPPESLIPTPPFTTTPSETMEVAASEPDADLWPLLGEIPPPIPDDWMPEATVSEQRHSFLDELLEDSPPDPFTEQTVAIKRQEIAPAAEVEPQVEQPHQPLVQAEVETQPQAEVTVETTPDLEEQFVEQPQTDPLAETVVSRRVREQTADPTVASRKPASEDEITFEPVSSSVYNLTYACVLVPRFPNHHLTGDMANRLSDWITHLCVAFGWRLEHLSIRPDYLQWMVNVPPNTSPGYLMRTVRQHTSRRMFIEFPTMETENPSGDFWAPGYLILGSTQPPPAHLVLDFIRSIRRRQGISK
jgi:REP element-mobilizing transposase RayT/CheY-like chemotaxis protein